MRRRIVPTAVLAVTGICLLPIPSAGAATAKCHGKVATIVGDDRSEVLQGTRGDDVIVGGKGNDTIYGSFGNDVICGGRGADRLFGAFGNDKLYGGLDYLHPNDEGEEERIGDLLDGGGGDDVLRPGIDTREAEDVTLDSITWGDSQGVHIDIAKGVAKGNEGRDIFSVGETWIVGSGYNDVIDGTSGDDLINGGPGSDTLRGFGGKDHIIADSYLRTEHNADVVHGGDGDDQISAIWGQDQLYGGPGNDAIDDTGRSNDVLVGGSGNDLLIGQLWSGTKAQSYDGGTGFDTISIFTTLLNPAAEASTGTWDMASGQMTFSHDTSFGLTVSGFEHGDLNTYGTSWTVTGTDDAEELVAVGTSGTQFQALAGDDSFFGSPSNDTFDGGDGTDTSLGMGGGDDTCISVEAAPAGDCDHQS